MLRQQQQQQQQAGAQKQSATRVGSGNTVGQWQVRIVCRVCPTQLQQRVINKFLQLILAVGCHIALLLMVPATMAQAQAQQRQQLPTVAPAPVAVASPEAPLPRLLE